MKFKSGKPKTGGRKKGSLNKASVEQKQRIESVLSILDETLEEDIESLPKRERVKLWFDLQEFIRPKLARKEISNEGPTDKPAERTTITFSNGITIEL